MPSTKIKIKNELLFYFLLVCAITMIYGQSLDFPFIDLDDPEYVGNFYVQKGLTIEGLKWAFTSQDKVGIYWHPLTWLSHMIDISLFGNHAELHHLMNMIWHILNTCLLFLFLHKTTRLLWPSIIVASYFAVHPINVESVVWIAERKNLLSTFFWLLSLIVYVFYARKPGFFKYILLVTVFILGLSAKSMLITLPFVFLLIDYWPLERISFNRDRSGGKQSTLIRSEHNLSLIFLEKIVLLGVATLVTFIIVSEQATGDFVNKVSFDAVPLSLRIENLFVSYAAYLGKSIWPFNLAVFYPFPESLSWELTTFSAIILGGITYAVIWPLREKKYLTVGWLWFLGTLVPVSGLIQAGTWPSMADRWSYIPSIGLFICFAWSIQKYCCRDKFKTALVSFTTIFIGFIFGILSWHQVQYWRNTYALYDHTLAVTSRNFTIHVQYGDFLAKQGDIGGAIDHYKQAVEINPRTLSTSTYIADAFIRKGQTSEAINHYWQIITENPRWTINQHNLFVAQFNKDKNLEAIQAYQQLLQKKSDLYQIHNYIGLSQLALERYSKAILSFKKALKIKPDYFDAYNNLANTFFRIGDTENAIVHYRKALDIKKHGVSYYNFASALLKTGNPYQAIQYYKMALQQNNNNEKIYYDLAFALIDTKQFNEAILLFNEAFLINPDTNEHLNILAKIYAKQKELELTITKILKELNDTPYNHTKLNKLADILSEYDLYEESALNYSKNLLQRKEKDNNFKITKERNENRSLQETIDYYLTNVDSDNENYQTYANIALLFAQLGNNDAAINYSKKALSLAPENTEIHYNLACTYVVEGDKGEAKKHYAKALEINPSFIRAHNNLGIILAEENNLEQAINHFETALQIDPSFIDGYISIGATLYQQGKKDEAIQYLEEAVKLKPDNQKLKQMLNTARSKSTEPDHEASN